MTDKTKVTLTHEQETLLIPLYAKAQNNALFVDHKANEVLDGIDYDFSRLRIPQKTAVTLRMRASQLDAWTRDFLQQHSDALVLHPGCGLDSRCVRVQQPRWLWVDLDMPDVIGLRREFYSEDSTYRMIPSSVTDLAWLDQVEAGGRPVLIIAEGLLMYLPEEQVKALFDALAHKFPGCELIFDVFSMETVRRIHRHPSLAKTGASIHWGSDNLLELESWGMGIKVLEEWFFSQSKDIARLSPFYRFMFRLTASIPASQMAQRLARIRLG